MNKTVTVRFGLGAQVTLDFPSNATVGDVLRDERVRAALRFGDNVRALVDRVEQPLAAPIAHGDTIELEQKASTKGA